MNSLDISKLTPIFISGVYRAGTTLLALMLNSSSSIRVTYDSVHFMRFAYNNYAPVNAGKNYTALIKDIQRRIEKRWERTVEVDSIIRRLNGYEKVNYAIVYHELMSGLLFNGDQNMIWGDKTNVCWGRIPDFLTMFPNGLTIHLVRDPRDVLASYKRYTVEPGLLYLDSVFASIHSMRTAMQYKNELPEDHYLLIKYEELVNEPEKVLNLICNKIGVPFETSMLDQSKFIDRTGKPWSPNTSFDKKINGISATPIGRYKKNLNRVEVFFTEMIARGDMEQYGYELEGCWLDREEWNNLFQILTDRHISLRFKHWLKTNQGVESYPTPPPLVGSARQLYPKGKPSLELENSHKL